MVQVEASKRNGDQFVFVHYHVKVLQTKSSFIRLKLFSANSRITNFASEYVLYLTTSSCAEITAAALRRSGQGGEKD